MEPVSPPRKNRRQLRDYNQHLYQLRHRAESAFLYLKRWREIATHMPERPPHSWLLFHIRCTTIWAEIL